MESAQAIQTLKRSVLKLVLPAAIIALLISWRLLLANNVATAFDRVIFPTMLVLFSALLIAIYLPACRDWPLELFALIVVSGYLICNFYVVLYLNQVGLDQYRHKTLPQWFPVIYVSAFIVLAPRRALLLSLMVYLLLWLPGVWHLSVFGVGSFQQDEFLILLTIYQSNPLIVTLLYAIVLLKRHVESASVEARLLERAANVDALTGVANRRAIGQLLERLLRERPDRQLAVALLDVDRFKAINDTHGHAVGDEVLAAVAQAAAGSLRGGDHFGRWGGEEFLAILSEVDAPQAGAVAERVRQAVAALALSPPGPVSASLGVALLRPGDTPEQLIARADSALYQAKAAGRDRVVLAEG